MLPSSALSHGPQGTEYSTGNPPQSEFGPIRTALDTQSRRAEGSRGPDLGLSLAFTVLADIMAESCNAGGSQSVLYANFYIL